MAAVAKARRDGLALKRVELPQLLRSLASLPLQLLQRFLRERAVVPRDDHPFTASPFWPPLDDSGRPKPLLCIFLALLSYLMHRVFYGANDAKLNTKLHERKHAMRVAQATSTLLNQQKVFHLGKKHVAALREKDPDAPTVFEGSDDLLVKKPVRVPIVLDLSSFTTKPEDLPAAAKGPTALETDIIETNLKGRTLKMIRQGGSLTKVSTTCEVEDIFEQLTDNDYPVLFIFESAPAKAQELFDLVIDRAYYQRVSQLSAYTEEERSRFRALEHVLMEVAPKQLEETIMRTLQARNMEGAKPVLPKDAKLVDLYRNADRLKGDIEFFQGSKHWDGALALFPTLVPQPMLLEATLLRSTINRSQRKHTYLLWEILKPCLPYWVVGTIIHSWLECVVAQLFRENFASRVFKLIDAKKIGQDSAKVFLLQWSAGWFMLKVWGWFSANLLFSKSSWTFNFVGQGRIIEAVMRQDAEYFDVNPPDQVFNNTAHDVGQVGQTLLWTSKEIITEGVAIFANAYTVYKMAPWSMFVTSVAPLPVIVVGQILMNRREHLWHVQAYHMRQNSGVDIGQIIREIRTVRDFAAEHTEEKRIMQIQQLMIDIDVSRMSKTDIIGHMFDMLNKLGEAVTILIACREVAEGRLSSTDAVVVMTTLSSMVGAKIKGVIDRIKGMTELIDPVRRLQDLLLRVPSIEPFTPDQPVLLQDSSQVQVVLAALSKDGMVKQPLELRSEEGHIIGPGHQLVSLASAGSLPPEHQKVVHLLEASPSKAFPLRLNFSRGVAPVLSSGRLEFSHVEFRYPAELRVPVLRDVSFSIEFGSSAALVGPTGCGKTTVLKLMRRLYDPTKGEILINGTPLQEYDIRRLRRKIATVAQDCVLFSASIRDNISYGMAPEPSEEAVWDALRKASAAEFVEAFPDKLYSRVGPGGLPLSGGQRQRLSIARALIRSPEIIILDEATSSLDPINEKIVQQAIDRIMEGAQVTVIMVAHRLTTVKKADQILVFDDGRIVEKGTHEDLLQISMERDAKNDTLTSGFYRCQWESMMGTANEEPGSSTTSPSEDSSDMASDKEKALAQAGLGRTPHGAAEVLG